MIVINVGAGVRFGVGLDQITQDVRGEAIAYERITSESGGQIVPAAGVVLIETQEAFMNSLNISVAASVRYGTASMDASMSFAESHAVNDHKLCMLFKVQVANPPKHMVAPQLTDEAKSVYIRDPEQFRAIYGDVYVDEIYGGGMFLGFFEFETRDERSKTELGGKLHGAVGGFLAGGEISASFDSTIQEFKGKTNMSITVQMSGGSGLENPSTLDELKELYQHFNAAARDNPVDYQASLKEFKYLPLPPGSSWVEQAVRRDTIETCGRYVIDSLSMRSNVDFILKYPDQFEWPSNDPNVDALNAYRGQLDERLAKWARRATACTNNIDQCAIAPDEQPPMLPTLPPRKEDSDPLNGKWEDIKHHDDRAKPYFNSVFLEGTLNDDYERGPRDGRYKIFKSAGNPIAGIFWQANIGAFVVYGGLFAEYLRRDLCNGPLGYPTSDEEPYGDQDRISYFQGGLLWWDHTSAVVSDMPKSLAERLKGIHLVPMSGRKVIGDP